MANLSPAEYRGEVDRHMTEKTLQKRCELALRELGCYVYHPYDSRKSSPGYPDITAVSPDGRLGFFELKTEKGRLSEYQGRWLNRLAKTDVTVAVIRPSDYDALIAWARGDSHAL